MPSVALSESMLAALAAQGVHCVAGSSDSPVILLCEHASFRVPGPWRNLGLDAAQLHDHIAWDPGAAALTLRVASLLGCNAVLAGYSRLFVDCNRDSDLNSYILASSDGVAIGGNSAINDEERAARTAIAYETFHARAAEVIDAVTVRSHEPLLIAIHSFTPRLQQKARPWHVGVLWKRRNNLTTAIMSAVRAEAKLLDGTPACIGDNEPYSGKEYLGATLERHSVRESLEGVCIEVRSDQLANPILIEHWSDILARCIHSAVADTRRRPAGQLLRAIRDERQRIEATFTAQVPANARAHVRDYRNVGNVPCLQVDGGQSNGDGKDVVLYVHGGCFVLGSPWSTLSTLWSVAHGMSATFLSIDYRLAPEHPFPAARDDVLAVFKALLSSGQPPDRLFLFGDSAGAHIVLSALLHLRDSREPQPAAVALISPWLDLNLSGDTVTTLAEADTSLNADQLRIYARAYAGARGLHDPGISPLFCDLRGLSPVLVQAGTREILLSDAVRFVRAAKDAGTRATLDIWEGLPHVFHLDFRLPQALAAGLQIAGFFRHRRAGQYC